MLAFYAAWFINIFLYGMRSPLEPVGTTKYVLELVIVGPFLREQINQLLAEQGYSDVMRVTSAPGLAELSDREQVIATSTLHEVAQLSQTMARKYRPVGSSWRWKDNIVAISLRSIASCRIGLWVKALASFRDVHIMISAPMEYATRDFILHLFEKFCETVLQVSPDAAPPNTDSISVDDGRQNSGSSSLEASL